METNRHVLVEEPNGDVHVGVDENVPVSEPNVETRIIMTTHVEYINTVKYTSMTKFIMFLFTVANFCLAYYRGLVIDVVNFNISIITAITVHLTHPLTLIELTTHIMFILTSVPIWCITHKWVDVWFQLTYALNMFLGIKTAEYSLSE